MVLKLNIRAILLNAVAAQFSGLFSVLSGPMLEKKLKFRNSAV